jgi:ferredoxin
MSENPTTAQLAGQRAATEDFGAGKAMAVASMCLRFAKLPGSCTLCIDGCPVGAIEAREHALFTTDACLRCGACVAVCPTGAVATTRVTVQELTRKLLDAARHSSTMAVACKRARDYGQAGDASLLARAADEGLLVAAPCLAMLGAPSWFAVLNEAEESGLKRLGVLLPPGICSECPANGKGNAEDAIDEAVSAAEGWAQATIEIYASAQELPLRAGSSLGALLDADGEADRREALGGVFKSLRDAWEDAGKPKRPALSDVQAKRARKAALANTRLSQKLDVRQGDSDAPRGTVTPSRFILVQALGQNPANAANVSLTVSATHTAACTLCGRCVEACALHARQIVSAACENPAGPDAIGNAADAGRAAVTQLQHGHAQAAASARPPYRQPASTPGRALSPKAPPEQGNVSARPTVLCDELFCVGCGACIEVCETRACYLTSITAESYLLVPGETAAESQSDGALSDAALPERP